MIDDTVDGETPVPPFDRIAASIQKRTADKAPRDGVWDSVVLSAKLARPRPPPGLVPRPRVTARLETGNGRPVTLVSAGPGWGKTLAVAAWASQSPPGLPVGWLSLDGDDNEPGLFWSYVLAALRSTGAVPEDNPLARLAPANGVDAGMLHRIEQGLWELPRPVALVLDDAHELHDKRVLDGLAELLRHPIEQLRLVLVTRRDPLLPLHRLRVSHELLEIRAGDLAFQPEEAAALLAGDGLDVAADSLAVLMDRTEGWAAGLRLAAMHLHRTDAAGRVEDFAGEERAVADYMLAEVVDSQPPDLRSFLLHTSVAARVCGPLADALTGGRRGQEHLERLEAANTFVNGLDADRRWYRYHHLLQQMLQHQLALEDPGIVPLLHRRAALWHADHGRAVDALRHAVAAEDGDLLGRLFGALAAPRVVSIDRRAFDAVLGQIPAPKLAGTAELHLAAAARLFAAGRFTEMAPHLASARRLVADASRPEPGTLVFLRLCEGMVARAAGRLDGVVEAVSEVLQLLDGPAASLPAAAQYRAIALGNKGGVLLWLGRLEEAQRWLELAVPAAEAAGVEAAQLNAAGHLALAAAARGILREAAAHGAAALELAEKRGWTGLFQCAQTYLALAAVSFHRHDLDAADAFANRAATAHQIEPERTVLVASHVLQARIGAARGAVQLARRWRERAREECADWTVPPFLAHWLTLAEAEIEMAAGDPAAAVASLTTSVDGQYPFEQERVALAAALLASGHTRAADDTLGSLREQVTDPAPAVQVWLLTALAADRLGDDDRVLTSLRTALRFAEPEQMRRPFLAQPYDGVARLLRRLSSVDQHVNPFAGRLLDAIDGKAVSTRPPPLAEPLSVRERTVLTLLPSMMTNSEIADYISISTNTVKAHLRAVYRKLDVGSRRQAVTRAWELGLLEPPATPMGH
jgi:LuxR family maltose regulon positive regulatory protein